MFLYLLERTLFLRCLSWSPRGKQLVVGSSTGTLTQYTPTLKAMKSCPAPSLGQDSAPPAVLALKWLSSFQFLAVYRDQDRPAAVVVNAPKAGPVSFVNFDDVCYGGGGGRRRQFYLLHVQTWSVALLASADSVEVGVLATAEEDPTAWRQWVLEDAARAELPMAADRRETFPLGMALDTGNARQLPWGDNLVLPPPPVLLALSDDGDLCLFLAVNLHPGAATLCSPPELPPDPTLFVAAPAAATHASSRVNLSQK